MTVASIARVAALLVASTCAQAQSKGSIVGLVTDADGKLVEGASVRFVPDGKPDIPALVDVTPPSDCIESTTDARGMFRISSDHTGLVLVSNKAGLGALALRCWPGRASALRLSPMAELADFEGGEIAVFAAARLESGGTTERRLLPTMRGQTVRLPAGDYEIWWLGARGATWQSVSLQEGLRVELRAPRETVSLTVEDQQLSPVGFPHLQLPKNTALLGDAARAVLLARSMAAETEAISLRLVDAPDGTHCALLLGAANGTFAVVANPMPSDGIVLLPSQLRAGDDWVLAHAPGRAAQALPLMKAMAAGEVRWRSERSVSCAITDPDGSPAGAAAVTYRPTADGPVTARAFCDELGNARLGPISGSGVVSVEGEGHLPFRASLAEEDAAPLVIRLEAGLRVAGTARFSDLGPANAIVVTLRDPSGRMRPATRTCVTASDGSFAFSGLDSTTRWLAFASTTRDGKTFSARCDAHGGSDPIVLVLEDEDPKLKLHDR